MTTNSKLTDKLHILNQPADQRSYDFDVSEVTEKNAREMQRIKEAALANGSFMKAPNGSPTSLSERQWLQVRTEDFKQWFGDWEAAAKYDYLLSESWVAHLTGSEFQKDATPLTEKVAQFYLNKYNGQVERKGFGIVVLDKKGVKDSIAHGIGSTKSAAFAAVPDIIKSGVVIDKQVNWKERGKDTYVIATPLQIRNEGYTGIVIVTQAAEKNRFYLHEVVLQKSLRNIAFQDPLRRRSDYDEGNLSAGTANAVGADILQKDIVKLLQNLIIAKKNSSKALDANGEPLIFIHQTDHIFNTFREGFGSLGRGIYFLPKQKQALKWYGSNDMEVFLNIKNPINLNQISAVSKFGVGAIGTDKILREKGVDGIISDSEYFGETVVFKSPQIKSAISNNGSFNEASDDIRFQLTDAAHLSTHPFTPISRRELDALVGLLNRTGLARSVITDEAGMREYLEQSFGKEGADRFMVWYHGSINDFDKFERFNAFTRSYDGIYFSSNKAIPRDYGTILYEVELPELADEQKPFSKKEREKIEAELSFSKKMRESYGHINFDVATGEVIAQLTEELGSVEAAHNWLMRAGVDGYTRESEADGRIAIMFNDKAIKIKSKAPIRPMATPRGEVYGFVTPEGDIYLDPGKINANTPIHEFGHLWCDFVEKNNPQLWAKITELVRQTPYYTDLLNNPTYANLNNDNARCNEAFAQAVGDGGERVFHSRAMGSTFKDRFRALLQDFWSWIGQKLGIRSLTPEQISRLTFAQAVKGAIADLTGGKAIIPTKVGKVELSAEQRSELAGGRTITLTGLTDKNGKKYVSNVRWSAEKNRPEFTNLKAISMVGKPLKKEKEAQGAGGERQRSRQKNYSKSL
jgi:hypothetical protein